MRIATSLSLLLAAGCADQMPNPKAWSVDETTSTTVSETTPVPIEVSGEAPETINTGLRPLFPPHGVTTPDNTPRFAWASSGGDPALLICEDHWCNEPLRRIQMRDGASETTLVEPLPPGLHWWAIELDGEQSFARSFVVSATAGDRDVTGHWGMRVDIGADGYADVATVPTDGTAVVGVAHGGPNALQSPRIWDGGMVDEQSWVANTVAAVDHNGTGMDWLAIGYPDSFITLSPDYVRGRFDVAADWDDAGFGATVTAVGDVNGDGYGDVAVSSASASYISIVFGGTGREDTRVQTIAGRNTLGPAIAGPADFDEDGYSDFVLRAYGGVYLARGGSDGVQEFQLLHAPAESELEGFADSLAVGDANGDGRPDIVAGEASGCWTLFYAEDEGFGTFRNCVLGDSTTETTRVALVDYDADGLDELVTTHHEPFSRCGLRSVVLVWHRLDGDGFRVFERDTPGAAVVTPGDVDGDGANDAVIVLGTELTIMRPAF